MPIEAAAISFQICKITILMFCDTIDNIGIACIPPSSAWQRQKRTKNMVKHSPYVWKQQSPCIYVCWPLSSSHNIKVIVNVFRSFLLFSSYLDTTVIWAAHEAIRQWINNHCGCTEWKWKWEKKTENENNSKKKRQERSRWNNKMKLTTNQKTWRQKQSDETIYVLQ